MPNRWSGGTEPRSGRNGRYVPMAVETTIVKPMVATASSVPRTRTAGKPATTPTTAPASTPPIIPPSGPRPPNHVEATGAMNSDAKPIVAYVARLS